MSIFTWILFGLVVGVIANLIDPRPARGGVLGAMVLGIIGAVLGGFLGNLLLGVDVSGFNFTSVVLAVAGSLLLMYASRAFTRRSY